MNTSDIRIVRHSGGEMPGGGFAPAYIEFRGYWDNEFLGTVRDEEQVDSAIKEILDNANK